jgi:uracil-DNA glycosylase
MSQLEKRFEPGWWHLLAPFFFAPSGGYTPEFSTISHSLVDWVTTGKNITPKFEDTFRAFKECPYHKLKVVLLGLDPYPSKGIADGLAFSAKDHSLDPPKSLLHMINAIEKDVYGGFAIGFNEEYTNTDLTRWAKQGVLLLNTALSTTIGATGAHLEMWAPFTRFVFKQLRENNSGVIYILLGGKAKQWAAAIDKDKNYILTASHPASVCYNGKKEWDCEGVFSGANAILEEHMETPIKW